MAINSNVRMLIVNDANDAVLSLAGSTTEVETMPLTNLQIYSKSESFRTLDITQAQFTFVWDTPRILSGVVLRKHNMSELSTWVIEIFSDQAMTTKVYDSTVANGGQELQAVEQKSLGELDFLIDALVSPAVDGPYHDSDHWFDDELAYAMRITLKDPSNDHGFIDVNQLFAGRALQPSVNFTYGYKFGWLTKIEQKRTAGGSVYATEKSAIRSLKFDLDHLNEADRPRFVNAIQRVQGHTVFYVSMFPGAGGQLERHYAMACVFTSLPEVSSLIKGIYKAPYSIGEA